VARISILDRFRPVGAPGPAGPSGVPAADDQGPVVELVPVFAALADDVEACVAIVEEARGEAERDLAQARKRAAAIISQARFDAVAARAMAASRVEREAAERDARVLDQARMEADAVEASALERIPGVVDKAVSALLDTRNTGSN